MKKIISLILALMVCLSLCACGGRNSGGYDPSKGNVLITKDMLPEIRAAVLSDGDSSSLNFLFESDALRAANARISAGGSSYQDIKTFSSIKITSEDYEDEWHYCFYGKIFGKDDFNKSISLDFSLSVYCPESETDSRGYTVERYGISIGT